MSTQPCKMPRYASQLCGFLHTILMHLPPASSSLHPHHCTTQAYAECTGRAPGEVQLEDVVRAMETQDVAGFAAPPSLDVRVSCVCVCVFCLTTNCNHHSPSPPLLQTLMELAEQRNKERLPQPKANVYGLRLPPESASLVLPNFQMKQPPPAPAEGAPPPAANQ